MPQFRVTAPDGTPYDVTAPDGATEQDALARVRFQHLADQQTAAQAAQPANNAAPAAANDDSAALPNPKAPESSWLQTGIDTIKQVPGAVEKSAGGIVRFLGENQLGSGIAGPGVTSTPDQLRDQAKIGDEMAKSAGTPGTLANIGKQTSDEAQKALLANAPNVSPGSAKYYANMLGVGIAQTLPALGATVLTGNAAPIIVQTAASSFGTNYADAMEQNPNDPHGAAVKATALASVDTAAAVIGLKAFGVTPFTSAVGKISNAATGEFATVYQQTIADIIKNVMVQGVAIQPAIGLVNRGVDNWINGKPITDGMKDEYVTGALQNTLIMGITHMATRPGATMGDVQQQEAGTVQGMAPGHGMDEGAIDATYTAPAPAGTPRLPAPIDPRDVQPGDEESPIPTSIIAAGRKVMREAGEAGGQPPVSAEQIDAQVAQNGQTQEPDQILGRNGWPQAGTAVTLDNGDGPTYSGTIHSGFTADHPEQPGTQADALRVRLDNGDMLTAFRHELDAAGVTITPQQAQQAGLPLDVATTQTAPAANGVQPQPAAPVQPPAGTAVTPEIPPAQAAHVSPSEPSGIKPMPVDLFQQPRAAAPPPPVGTEIAPAAAPPPTTGDGTQAAPITVTHPEHVAAAEANVNTAPTDAQAAAGNYQHGHIKVHGMDIAIENPKGSVRRGVDADGKPWEVTLPATYGYIKRTNAADGEQVDAYVGPNPQSSKVFVIDQKDAKTGAYDEAKSFIGFDTKEQALATYHAAFSDGLGPQRMGGIREMNTLQFKKLLNSGKLDKPIAAAKIPGAAAPEEITTKPNETGHLVQNQAPEEITKPAAPIIKTSRPMPAPSTETSVLDNIRRMGGIKTVGPDGQPTKEGQDIKAVLQDVKRPGLINNKDGVPADTIRESLQQHGWFGQTGGHDIQDLYDLIRKEVHEGQQFHPDSDKAKAAAEQAVTDANARALQDVHDEAKKGGGEPLTPEEAAQIVVNMGAHGINAEDAVADFIENKALREQYEDDAHETDHAPAAPEPVARGAGEVDRAHGQGGEEPAPAEGGESAAPAEGGPTPSDTGEAPRAPAEVAPAARAPRVKLSIAEKLAQRKPLKEPERQALLNAYFAVGRDVHGYGGMDRVTTAPEFGGNALGWQVGVREILKDGALGRERFHSTMPDPKRLLAFARSNPEFSTVPGESLKTEPGAIDGSGKALPQTIVPGAEKSAQQLAKAREASGHGRATTSAPQKDAGGLFAPKTEETKDMFAAPEPAAPEEKPAASTAPAKPATGIEDFGDVLTGARKHYAEAYRDRMAEAGTVDVAAEPLSKSWPEPDYAKMLEGGADPWTVSFIHAARDEIPTKPQKGWKLKGWVESVKALRKFSGDLLEGSITKEVLQEKLKQPEYLRLRSELEGRTALYQAVGHDVSLKGVRLYAGSYSLYKGVQYKPAKIIWTVEKPQKASAFSNWPRVLAEANTREEAIEAFKGKVSTLSDEPATKEVRFDIYSKRGTPGFIIGKKVGKGYLDLKTFDDVKAARAYLASNKDDLIAALERRKYIPNERKESNSPRVGIDHRSGGDVTPEQFSDAFGFRGVQFGNYVEGGRRQADLNEAYDALMDMAGILDVPAKALSLNGELGLAFGARGTGGTLAAAAHYEPGTIVINLTKNRGAGSLAHEWWHAMDNYFSRNRGDKGGYLTEKPFETAAGIRPEMVAAFRGVAEAIKGTAIPKRSQVLDNRRSSPYWATGREMSARSFESYIIARLEDQSASNDYLANIVSEDYWKAAESLGLEGDGGQNPSYPYPTADEAPAIRAAFDHVFQTIETGEGEGGKRPLFQPSANQTGTFGDQHYELDAPQSPEKAEQRKALAVAMRAEMDRIGLHDVGLKVADSLTPTLDGEAQFRSNAVYWKGIISVALNSDAGHMASLHHEEIHAIRDFDLFDKAEWSILEAKAKSTWRSEYKVDERWPDLAGNEDKLNEEAVAEAYSAFQKEGFKGIIGRIFAKLRNFLSAIARGLHELGFGKEKSDFRATAESIFGKIDSGEVGARPRTELPYRDVEHEPSFQQPVEDRDTAFDEAWSGAISAAAKKLGWDGEPTSAAMYRKAFLMPKGPARVELTRNAGLIKALEDQRATPFRPGLTPIKGDGETKVRGAAQSAADKAAKSGQTLEDLPEYDVSKQAPIIARATKFADNDANYEQAKAVAMGTEPAPYGTTSEAMLIAVENRATREGDWKLLQQLGTKSALLEELTTMGQRISMMQQRDPTSPVAAIKSVQAARAAASKAKSADAPKAKRNVVKDMLDAANKEAKQQAKKMKWQSFIHSITCEGK